MDSENQSNNTPTPVKDKALLDDLPAKTPSTPAGLVSNSEEISAQVAEKINRSFNILIALSKDPNVDEISAAIALAILLDQQKKHVTTIYSGKTPNTLEFLRPEETFQKDTSSLQDFIIALNKSKADHLTYRLDGDYVKIFITPYKGQVKQEDLEYSYGDYNVDLVIVFNVNAGSEIDSALTEYGRIMHDATAINITSGVPGHFADLEWSDPSKSSVCEMVFDLAKELEADDFTEEIATALLTGILSATERFSNNRTKPTTMAVASKLMEAGADQQLISANILKPETSIDSLSPVSTPVVDNTPPVSAPIDNPLPAATPVDGPPSVVSPVPTIIADTTPAIPTPSPSPIAESVAPPLTPPSPEQELEQFVSQNMRSNYPYPQNVTTNSFNFQNLAPQNSPVFQNPSALNQNPQAPSPQSPSPQAPNLQNQYTQTSISPNPVNPASVMSDLAQASEQMLNAQQTIPPIPTSSAPEPEVPRVSSTDIFSHTIATPVSEPEQDMSRLMDEVLSEPSPIQNPIGYQSMVNQDNYISQSLSHDQATPNSHPLAVGQQPIMNYTPGQNPATLSAPPLPNTSSGSAYPNPEYASSIPEYTAASLPNLPSTQAELSQPVNPPAPDLQYPQTQINQPSQSAQSFSPQQFSPQQVQQFQQVQPSPQPPQFSPPQPSPSFPSQPSQPSPSQPLPFQQPQSQSASPQSLQSFNQSSPTNLQSTDFIQAPPPTTNTPIPDFLRPEAFLSPAPNPVIIDQSAPPLPPAPQASSLGQVQDSQPPQIPQPPQLPQPPQIPQAPLPNNPPSPPEPQTFTLPQVSPFANVTPSSPTPASPIQSPPASPTSPMQTPTPPTIQKPNDPSAFRIPGSF